ncbi:hypothetical protein IFM89_033159 [Coptis chinensis]|uniref:Reverse transcriptase zinc-binding domain-containing protein n=1 Tax=Coptis chinensis TaxID=261450 RepID=A0A835IH43_9MAGN|nr:hypothetical protein IFM89_033159 [Coptis chinensis]
MKSKGEWFKGSERNTAYYHRICNIRTAKSMISELETEEGNLFRSQEDINRCYAGREDYRVWKPDLKGEFLVRSAHEELRHKGHTVWWHKVLWNSYINPKVATIAWKICLHCVATDKGLKRRGFKIASKCYVGCAAEGNINHILWECEFAKGLWTWLSSEFDINAVILNMRDAVGLVKNRSPLVKHLWHAAVITGNLSIPLETIYMLGVLVCCNREDQRRLIPQIVFLVEVVKKMEMPKKKEVLLFYCVESEELARKVATLSDSIQLQSINWRSFDDGFPNLFINNAQDIRGRHVAFLASFS